MRTPAEWEPDERTLMGWPCRRELWGETIEQARSDYAAVANGVAAFEPVTMIANGGEDAALARAACSDNVEIVELPLDARTGAPIRRWRADNLDQRRDWLELFPFLTTRRPDADGLFTDS